MRAHRSVTRQWRITTCEICEQRATWIGPLLRAATVGSRTKDHVTGTERLKEDIAYVRAAAEHAETNFPSFLACAIPAFTRARKISRSNSANTASIPASARPLGVVRSSASHRDTNPTSSAFSSWSVFTKSTSDRPNDPVARPERDRSPAAGLPR